MSGFRVLRRVLVANRGEIAVRVIRTCGRLGIETVLAVSDADAGSLPARLADRVIRIGPAPAAASYLNVDAVISAAVAAGVDAVHPGYGFLSENARLARACAAAGIVFVGPAPETLEAAGDKLAAREHAVAAGLPVLPGGHVRLGAGSTPPLPGDQAPGFPQSVPGRSAGSHAPGAPGADADPGDASQEAPSQEAPSQGVPSRGAPSQEAASRGAAGQQAADPGVPGQEAPGQQAAGQRAPSRGAPSRGAASQEAPGPGTPGQGAPSRGAASRGAAGQEAARRGAAGQGVKEAGAQDAVALPGGADSPAEVAGRVGYPVLVKAAGGGGGRGLRVVRDPAELEQAVAVASAEAEAAFGDPRVYLERYVESGRHVEVQLLGDGEHVIHLGDRDCSVQRRYQKLIEEAPAPGLDDGLRERLRAAAVALGERLRYRGAGTVEFLVDAGSADAGSGEFYFLEVNARVQVEHPVTEAVTGIDVVAEQLALAEGRPLRLKQADVTLAGHAIEVRLNAEDPASDFRPSPGTVTRAVFPATTFSPGAPALASAAAGDGSETGDRGTEAAGAGSEAADGATEAARGGLEAAGGAPGAASAGTASARAAADRTGPRTSAGDVRVDTHLQAGATVPAYYDSLLAKVIARGSDRAEALATLRGALGRCAVDGVTTNLGLHRALLADPEFTAGGVDTGYLARWLARGPGSAAPDAPARPGYRDGAGAGQAAGDQVAGAAPQSPGPASGGHGGHGAGAGQPARVVDRPDPDPRASEPGASDPQATDPQASDPRSGTSG